MTNKITIASVSVVLLVGGVAFAGQYYQTAFVGQAYTDGGIADWPDGGPDGSQAPTLDGGFVQMAPDAGVLYSGANARFEVKGTMYCSTISGTPNGQVHFALFNSSGVQISDEYNLTINANSGTHFSVAFSLTYTNSSCSAGCVGTLRWWADPGNVVGHQVCRIDPNDVWTNTVVTF